MANKNNLEKRRQAEMNEVWQRIEKKASDQHGDLVGDLVSNRHHNQAVGCRCWLVAMITISIIAIVAVGVAVYLFVTKDQNESAGDEPKLQLSEEQLAVNESFLNRAHEVSGQAAKTDDPAERRNLYATELQLYQAAGDATNAQAVVDKILAEYPDDFTSYSVAGDFYASALGGNNNARAVGYYNKALDVLRQQEQTDEIMVKINYYQGRVNELAS